MGRECGRLEVVIDANSIYRFPSSRKYPIFARARRGHLVPVVLVGIQLRVWIQMYHYIHTIIYIL